MKANRAFFSGLTAGAILTIIMAILRQIGWLQINFEMTLGTLGTTPGLNAWIIGFHLHLLVAGVFALFYGEIFEKAKRAGAKMGMLVALIQAVVVGIALGFLPVIHPRLGEEIPVPGFFAINYGIFDVVMIFALHAIFGLIVGVLYEKPLHAGAQDYVRT